MDWVSLLLFTNSACKDSLFVGSSYAGVTTDLSAKDGATDSPAKDGATDSVAVMGIGASI